MEDAILEGRPPSKLRAVGHAILEGLFITPIIHSWNTGTSIRDKRLEEYDRKYKDHWGIEARIVALGDGLLTISGYNMGVQLGQEELEAEMQRALANGEDMSRWRFTKNATLRVLGEVTMISSICRSITRDWEAEARWHDSERRLRNYVAARAGAALKDLEGIRAEMKWLRAHYPGHPKIAALQKHLDARLKLVHDLAKRMKLRLGAQDPLTQAMYKELKLQGWGAGGAVSLRQIMKSWYCTNRPKIEVILLIQELVRRGTLPEMPPEELRRVLAKMAGHMKSRGLPGDELFKATLTAGEALETMTPDRLPKDCRWSGMPPPCDPRDPKALAKWRSGMVSSLRGNMLRAMSGRDSQAISAYLKAISKTVGFSKQAQLEIESAQRAIDFPKPAQPEKPEYDTTPKK